MNKHIRESSSKSDNTHFFAYFNIFKITEHNRIISYFCPIERDIICIFLCNSAHM